MGWKRGIALVILLTFSLQPSAAYSQTAADPASGQPGSPSPPSSGAIEQPPAPAISSPQKTEPKVIQTPSKEKEPPAKKSDVKEITKEGDYITINFNNIELQAFTKFISDLTQKNFIIDDKVQGKVTIVSPTRISKEEAYQVFLSVLEVKGFTAVETDNVIKIIPSREVKQSGVKVISDKERDIRGEGFVTKIFHLNYVSPAELTKTITPLISKDGNIIPYLPTNALIVTDSYSNIKKLTDIVNILDVEPPKGKGKINVYYLKNASAEEVAKVLTGIVSKVPIGQQAGSPATGIRSVSFESGVLVTPDKATNSLVIIASPEDYETLKSVISQLDIKRRQVYVEAAIMEISLDKQRELGIEFRSVEKLNDNRATSFGGTNFGGIGAATSGPEAFANILGLAVGIVKGTFSYGGVEYLNIGALVRALQSESDVNILSTPNILTTDNQKAEIMVGENVPFITGKSQSAGQTLTTIERKDIGITLRLTPQISSDDHVTLEIYQEISSLAEAAGFDPSVVGPVTTKRSASTTVVVKNGQTVAIAGLIRDNKSTIEHKIPLLGDIPLLGWFFKFQTKRSDKTNLMVFLTPYIIKESEDADKIFKEKKEKMEEFKKEHGIEGEKKS